MTDIIASRPLFFPRLPLFQYNVAHMKEASVWKHIEAARFYYISGFFLTVSPESIMAIAEHSAAKFKFLMMNISAPFICQARGGEGRGRGRAPAPAR